jgi:hypothetical protein
LLVVLFFSQGNLLLTFLISGALPASHTDLNNEARQVENLGKVQPGASSHYQRKRHLFYRRLPSDDLPITADAGLRVFEVSRPRFTTNYRQPQSQDLHRLPIAVVYQGTAVAFTSPEASVSASASAPAAAPPLNGYVPAPNSKASLESGVARTRSAHLTYI